MQNVMSLQTKPNHQHLKRKRVVVIWIEPLKMAQGNNASYGLTDFERKYMIGTK